MQSENRRSRTRRLTFAGFNLVSGFYTTFLGVVERVWTNDPDKHLVNPKGMREAELVAFATMGLGLLASTASVAVLLRRRAGWVVLAGFDGLWLAVSGFFATRSWIFMLPAVLAGWLLWLAIGTLRRSGMN
ncbi:hypothetical protein [Cystobacter ferrugineus]|uniref:Uncharacterized protein n=1 Tax=Cystobacter ferrugineus TaxID=83449 RepID=A0A1L9BDA7_9BACT|nr:hypothetical protein [Cystobacter ferrugineus]OJH40250.1 hypothetical protein BON30_14490 [Cystobacter ferrugineus]